MVIVIDGLLSKTACHCHILFQHKASLGIVARHVGYDNCIYSISFNYITKCYTHTDCLILPSER